MILILNPSYSDMCVKIEELDEKDPVNSFLWSESAYDILGDDYFDESTGDPIIEQIPFKTVDELE